MTALILIVGLVVWLVAAYALVRMALSWLRIHRAAPAGQGWAAALDLWSLNFDGVRQRLGAAASADVQRVAGSMKLFAGCALTLVALALIHTIGGSAT